MHDVNKLLNCLRWCKKNNMFYISDFFITFWKNKMYIENEYIVLHLLLIIYAYSYYGRRIQFTVWQKRTHIELTNSRFELHTDSFELNDLTIELHIWSHVHYIKYCVGWTMHVCLESCKHLERFGKNHDFTNVHSLTVNCSNIPQTLANGEFPDKINPVSSYKYRVSIWKTRFSSCKHRMLS